MNKQQLSEIRVKGYKSIKECDLQLNMINVLIGSNGSGKSNFISIFRLLQDIVQQRLVLHVNLQGGINAMLYNGNKITQKIEMNFFSDKMNMHFVSYRRTIIGLFLKRSILGIMVLGRIGATLAEGKMNRFGSKVREIKQMNISSPF